MICASVPLGHVITHIDETRGVENEAPASLRFAPSWMEDSLDEGDPTEVVFHLVSFRRAA